MKKHNFGAGPGILPASVMEEAARAVVDFEHSGMSILETSHRDKSIVKVIDEAEQLVRDLLQLSDDYEVMFLTGGASTQFFMLPMNLLNEDETATYINTGEWATRAIKEAEAFGKIQVAASSADKNFSYIPKNWAVEKGSKYLHITTNNTIFGTQYQEVPEVPAGTWLAADMSSDIFSRPIDAKKFDLIYAGAQKNMGSAGTTMVAVRRECLGTVRRHLPKMLDYRVHAKDKSSYNTPPVFAIYVSMLTMRWVQAQGGLAAMGRINAAKAQALYAELDSNPLFRPTVAAEDRSIMNVNFLTADPAHEKPFLAYCAANGIVGLNGHRSVGGCRASLYNALPLESVEYLVDLMRNFKP